MLTRCHMMRRGISPARSALAAAKLIPARCVALGLSCVSDRVAAFGEQPEAHSGAITSALRVTYGTGEATLHSVREGCRAMRTRP
jgi:hypothetical protein